MVALPAWAGRPLNINDTEPVAVGEVQFEASVAYRADGDCKHFEYPFTVASGIYPDVDLGIGFGGQFEERVETADDSRHEHGLCDLVVSPRWKFLDQGQFWPSQAVSFSVKFPTADDQKGLGSGATDYDLTWIATHKISERVQVDANVGYSWIGVTCLFGNKK